MVVNYTEAIIKIDKKIKMVANFKMATIQYIFLIAFLNSITNIYARRLKAYTDDVW
jgi:hypothetical protein